MLGQNIMVLREAYCPLHSAVTYSIYFSSKPDESVHQSQSGQGHHSKSPCIAELSQRNTHTYYLCVLAVGLRLGLKVSRGFARCSKGKWEHEMCGLEVKDLN